MKPVLEVNGLWKQYTRQARKDAVTSLSEEFARLFQPTKNKEDFWALQDISFSLEAGESLAIIGHNGAGKSTLLKILSRITPPSRGEIVLRGRLASLLEVGTGFHSELTGRENIYLNGSILGLPRADINRKFDEIIDFSGVENFLDTPLKHYSSGMQLRLAFSVAAHLEPEILVIDEVLAVGDTSFQQKCIDKMSEVANSGRTILFVSHNLPAIRKLCKTAILLENGKKISSGPTTEVIETYLSSETSLIDQRHIDLTGANRSNYGTKLSFSAVEIAGDLRPESEVRFEYQLRSTESSAYNNLLLAMVIRDKEHNIVYHLSNMFLGMNELNFEEGRKYCFILPTLRLKKGRYSVGLFLRAGTDIMDWPTNAFSFEVMDGNAYNFGSSDVIQGIVQPEFKFEVE